MNIISLALAMASAKRLADCMHQTGLVGPEAIEGRQARVLETGMRDDWTRSLKADFFP
jgi:hypothetical protein